MKAHEMRELSREELLKKTGEWEETYFRARCNKAIGQQQDTSVICKLRRIVARAKTIASEKNNANNNV